MNVYWQLSTRCVWGGGKGGKMREGFFPQIWKPAVNKSKQLLVIKVIKTKCFFLCDTKSKPWYFLVSLRKKISVFLKLVLILLPLSVG